MTWKMYLAAFGSFLMAAFPGNIFSCGPGVDPYDYYTSFFSTNLSEDGSYSPFYYTGFNFLYEEQEPVETSGLLADEWVSYCGSAVTKKDAWKLMNKFAWKDLNTVYFHIEKKQPLKVADSVKKNTMTSYFIQSKDLEALGYVMYAKQVEPFVVGGDYWEPLNRDAEKMNKLIKNGFQLFNAAKKEAIKLRYLYQVLRLGHYNGRYEEVISWYDQYMPAIKTTSLVKTLAGAIKAGAYLKTGEKEKAAYWFSKAFAESKAKRVSNFLGIRWSNAEGFDEKKALALCTSNKEKATLLALLNMHGMSSSLDIMQKILALNPGAEELETMVQREINKLEERYLSPSLSKEKGKDGYMYYYYWDENNDSSIDASLEEVKQLKTFLHNAAQNSGVKNRGLMEVAAAYCAYMSKDFTAASQYISAAETMGLSGKVKDQLMLTKLLTTINQAGTIDAAFEEKLLPSLQWLETKAKKNEEWTKFYRNLLSDIIGPRYHKQKELYKETLAYGLADWVVRPNNGEGWWMANAVSFLHNELESTEVEKLYSLMTGKQTAFEKYMLTHNSVTLKEVVDYAGTAYLREYNYPKAIEWFKKVKPDANAVIAKDPFIDLTFDLEEAQPYEAKLKTTKAGFAEEMMRLQKLAESDKANAAKHFYKLATGCYNMTYYGHAWELVQYGRSGVDGYYLPEDATNFDKEYYGCYTAEKYFEKAMNASADNNFKARCLFMMAKCAQKQVGLPQWNAYKEYDDYEKARESFQQRFMDNKYFPQLKKNYSTTAFYKEIYSTCSYLQDFVRRNK
jgi:hypothetical protein